MSVKCYVSVMCLVLVASCICMSVLCCYMVVRIRGGVRISLYIIYVHLCNHYTIYKVVVGLGAHICTLLEVWVLGVGMSTLGTQTVCTPRIGGSKYR